MIMTMTRFKPSHISPLEYLSQERTAKDKHEYYKGNVIALAGASLAHNDIVANLMREIGNFLKDKPCRILPSDIRVTIPSGEAYMYPDATIVCGVPEMEDDKFDTLKNPRVIFEVLSPSTAAHDRSKKFLCYQQIPSFKEYILIDSTEYFVGMSKRQDDGSWSFDASSDPDGYLPISSMRVNIPMSEVYRNVFGG
jgi:Uma2 family endonuclease